MSEEFSHEIEGEVTQAAIDAKVREYQAMREKQYNEAIAELESTGIEATSLAAYESTLDEIGAVPIGEVMWPSNDPRYRLHRAIEYGAKLTARRSEIEQRFGDKFALDRMFALNRYALAALHAFKVWRSNPDPEQGFSKLLQDAAQARALLRSYANAIMGRNHIRAHELRHFDGGVTPQGIACDLFLLVGALRDVVPRLSFRSLTSTELMEAELLANGLLRHAAGESYPDLWQPKLLYASAFTLVDRASFDAELVLAELHNEERDPSSELEWNPGCLFCSCNIERQRHHRHSESANQTRERAQFVSSTMTAVLGRNVVEN